MLVAGAALVAPAGASAATTLYPVKSTAAGDVYRVGAVKSAARARVLGYRHSPRVVPLGRHVYRGLFALTRMGKIARPVRIAAAAPRRRDPQARLVLLAPAPARDPAPAPAPGCDRAYSATSPWNTPIGNAPTVHPRNAQYMAAIGTSNPLTSDPTQYTLPVYYATNATPTASVTYVDGWFSEVTNGGGTLINSRGPAPAKRVTQMPIPAGLTAAAGSDAQVVIINTDTGEEWNASHFTKTSTGYSAWNVGHYNIAWSGVPPYDAEGNPFWLRGPGIPYLTGLIRPCEIAQGRIDHALAFALPKTSGEFVYPATRSDGQTPASSGVPEGTRMQLDPSISDGTIRNDWGCKGPCFTVAKAAQTYGMYVADTSGRLKVYFEYEATAQWNGAVTASTVTPIPMSAFRAIRPPAH